MKTLERQAAVLKAAGRIEGWVKEIGLLRSSLEAASLWRPAAGLARQCEEAVGMIAAVAARFDRSLVVTVIGPSGSGKSTLVNALLGGEEVSASGRERPTTAALVVIGGGKDAEELGRELGPESVDVRYGAGERLPERTCLIDTPDTDSTAFRRHAPALERAIAHSDVLVCVFDAENPKRRDHADFMAPFVRRFDGESLMAVLNKCDRLEETELRTTVLPDFLDYIRSAWQGAVDGAFCTSARRHVREPKWDPGAGPRHGFDQFEDLRRRVFGASAAGSLVIDRRLDNARQLHALVVGEVGREIAADRSALEQAQRALASAETEALAAAAAVLRGGDAREWLGMGMGVYQKLCQRWVGPVGWMLALWTRLTSLGTGITSLLRFGRPLGQVFGAFSQRPPGGRRPSGAAERLDAATYGYRLALVKRWPGVAEMLLRARFDPAVRSVETALSSGDAATRRIEELWTDCVDREVERICRRLGGFALQVLLNAPAVGILVYVGWYTLKAFFSSDYLSGDYFVHAFWAIAITLLLSFFALQVLIRLAAGRDRILARSFKRLEASLQSLEGPADMPVGRQLESLLRLIRAAGV